MANFVWTEENVLRRIFAIAYIRVEKDLLVFNHFNSLALELDIYIVAHNLRKMRIF